MAVTLASVGRPPFCCACGHEIVRSAATGTRSDLAEARTVHAVCVGRVLTPEFTSRFRALYAMEYPAARRVAMALNVVVTDKASRKYMRHAEVCFRAADKAQRLDETDWVAARARAEAPVKSTTAADSVDAALADAVAAALAEGLGDLDARMAEAKRSVEAAVTRLEEVSADLDGRVAQVALALVERKATEAAREAVLQIAPREVVVRVADRAPVNVGHAHRQLDRLLRMVSADVQVWLCGPAGSGKTTAAAQVARALGLPFRFNGAVDSEYKLSGFVEAQGRVVSTAFRKAYTEGGVYLFDEVDSSMASAVLAFNAALANGHADFPGEPEPVARHPDFRCLAAANTWGHGATTEYVGRNRMDAAFLDRFVQLSWEYDEGLERDLAAESGAPGAAEWCLRVQKLRVAARARGLKVVVSPRATIYGCRLLAAGMTPDEVLEATVTAKLTNEQRDALLGGAK